MSDGGKGSGRRPMQVSNEQFEANFDAIFGKKKRREEPTDTSHYVQLYDSPAQYRAPSNEASVAEGK